MSALAISTPSTPLAPSTRASAHDVERSMQSLMRELLAIRGTSSPAPMQLVDALRTRGLGRLSDVLEQRNGRLAAEATSLPCHS